VNVFYPPLCLLLAAIGAPFQACAVKNLIFVSGATNFGSFYSDMDLNSQAFAVFQIQFGSLHRLVFLCAARLGVSDSHLRCLSFTPFHEREPGRGGDRDSDRSIGFLVPFYPNDQVWRRVPSFPPPRPEPTSDFSPPLFLPLRRLTRRRNYWTNLVS